MTEKEFQNIVSTNKGKMFSLACSIVSNKEQAEDIINEVLVRLWNRLKIFPPPINVESYLFRSLRNACYDYLKMNKVRHKYETDEDVSVVGQNQVYEDERIDRNDTVKLVRRLIDKLADKEREVILLKDIYGYETDEIVKMLGITASNVRVRLSRARQQLKMAVLTQMDKT